MVFPCRHLLTCAAEWQAKAAEGDRVWKVGDVCECEDTVGATLQGLGISGAGRLIPLPPGMYFKLPPPPPAHPDRD